MKRIVKTYYAPGTKPPGLEKWDSGQIRVRDRIKLKVAAVAIGALVCWIISMYSKN